jgi:TPR repeat protein
VKTMADNGDMEAEIFLDYATGIRAIKFGGDPLQALSRSSERGCPVSQFKLGLYLQRENPQDEEAMALFKKAAKSGLCEAHFEIGRFRLSNP